MSYLPVTGPRFEPGTPDIRFKIPILNTARVSNMRGRISGKKNGRRKSSSNEINIEETRNTSVAYHNVVA
jgi:hypothetical protein